MEKYIDIISKSYSKYWKYLSVIFIALILSSCCSTKQVIKQDAVDNSDTEIKDIVLVPEVIVEVPKEHIDKPKTEEPELLNTETPEVIIDKELFDHSSWNTLLGKHVSEDGKVNYLGFKDDRKHLKEYIASLSNIRPDNSWSKADNLAYWMNAYNAMTIDLILRNFPLKSIKDIDKPWEQRLWKLGDKWYNLDEIEHQILRKMNEPRIHFGIVCASVSCPKLLNQAFTASSLDLQLTNATKSFLADSNQNKLTANKIELSKIFKWFAKDFKQNGTLIDFLNRYSEIEISNQAKKSFKDYNWNLND